MPSESGPICISVINMKGGVGKNDSRGVAGSCCCKALLLQEFQSPSPSHRSGPTGQYVPSPHGGPKL